MANENEVVFGGFWMFGLFKKKKRIVAIEVQDDFIRALSFTEGYVESADFHEAVLPEGLILEEVVQDEIAFFELMKELVKEWGIRNFDVYFFVPDQAVLMRFIETPDALSLEEMKQYVQMEIGESIHLPFKEPLIDVYQQPGQTSHEATLFAAPSEDSLMVREIYEDVKLHPTKLGIRALANLRLLEHLTLLNHTKTYLVIDWSIRWASVSIYSERHVDFLRYQSFDNAAIDWRYTEMSDGRYQYIFEGNMEQYHQILRDQMAEIERILNFYRFSLHKGEKAVDEIIMLGVHPEMAFIEKDLSDLIPLPITVLTDATIQMKFSNFDMRHSALLGLALKGAEVDGS